MALTPRIVHRGTLAHRLGQLALFGGFALFFFRAGTEWNRSGLGLLTDAIILAIAITGLNLITGYTGQISIGHSAFFAVGAYTSAILIDTHGWSPGWTFPISALVCFVLGFLVGLPALRLKGLYLALVTLGLAVAVPALLKYKYLVEYTGGALGIKDLRYLPPDWTPFNGRADVHKWIFWLTLFIFLLCSLVASNLVRSRIGRAMVAIRDNETAAAVMGVDRSITKTVVFGLSAAMTGLAGSLFALKLTLVDPLIPLFTILGSITFLVAMVIGGAASTWGPLVGALFFTYVNDFARSQGEERGIDGLGGVIFGVLLILLARFAPFGVVGLLRKFRAKVVLTIPRITAATDMPGHHDLAAATVTTAAPDGSSGSEPDRASGSVT
jgi:branched-chain amino acid transport system permease protein